MTGLLGFLCLTPARPATRPPWIRLAPDAGQLPPRREHGDLGGGVALLLLAVPAATRARWSLATAPSLSPPRSAAFPPSPCSRWPRSSRAARIQAIVELQSFSDLIDTAFGRAILIKIVLLLGLIGRGPGTGSAPARDSRLSAAEGATPGATGSGVAALDAGRDRARWSRCSLVTARSCPTPLRSGPPPARSRGNAELGPARLESDGRPSARRRQPSAPLPVRPPYRPPLEIAPRRLPSRAYLPDGDIGPLKLDTQKRGRPLRHQARRPRPGGRLADRRGRRA